MPRKKRNGRVFPSDICRCCREKRAQCNGMCKRCQQITHQRAQETTADHYQSRPDLTRVIGHREYVVVWDGA